MKKLLFTLLSVFILCSCSKDNDAVTPTNLPLKGDQYPQQWQLVKMTGMIANVPPSVGGDMTWKEYYLLQSDGSFTKTREQNNTTTTVKGTFKRVKLTDGEYLELTYEAQSTLICNCSPNLIEYLRIDTEKELIGTCWACDGPGLFYERTK